MAALKELAIFRGGSTDALLLPKEAAAYEAALELGSGARGICARMAVAATMLGTNVEARFWNRLCDTLAALQSVAVTRTPPEILFVTSVCISVENSWYCFAANYSTYNTKKGPVEKNRLKLVIPRQ